MLCVSSGPRNLICSGKCKGECPKRMDKSVLGITVSISDAAKISFLSIASTVLSVITGACTAVRDRSH
jgi:hypothetical protein